MKNTELSGEAKLTKRERVIKVIFALSLILGMAMGGIWSHAAATKQIIPMWVVIITTLVVLGLTVYYFSLRDEYQKSREYKQYAQGVILALCIMLPWYAAAEQSILPQPHVLITFFIIFIPVYLSYLMKIITFTMTASRSISKKTNT